MKPWKLLPLFLILSLFLGSLWTKQAVAQKTDTPAKKKEKAEPKLSKPTMANVAYGKHERQVLDFYQAKSDKPTPVVFFIHGGGWQGGDKKTNPRQFLDKGISVVAIN